LRTALLKDESSDIDLAGPTLPSLKAMLELPPDSAGTDSSYSRVVHGLLSACLLHVEEMRGRDGRISQMKTKNNMLAAVLVLTVVPPSIKLSQAAVEHCCYLIGQKLTGPTEVRLKPTSWGKFSMQSQLSLTAAHCAKTLISAASGNTVLQHCIKFLVPSMISYVAHAASLQDDPAQQETHAKATDEILRAFTAFFSSLPEDKRWCDILWTCIRC
jgi:hypothetical protein